MHEIAVSRLSPTTRERLQHAIENEASFANAGANTGGMFGRIFMMLLGLGGLAGIAAIDFGSPFSGIQPIAFLAGYAIAAWILLAQVFGMMRDARKKAATTMPQGFWCIALDVVEIDGPTLRVWPLVELVALDATHQHYNGAYSYTEFVFKFPGASKRFVVGNQADAEAAMSKMQGMRGMVAAAVESEDWETVVALDPLFELRTNDWAPKEGAGPDLRTDVAIPAWLTRSKTTALLAGAVLGFGVMTARNHVSDGAAFEECKRWNETWAWKGYLAQNGRHSDEVLAEHLPLANLSDWENQATGGGLDEAIKVAILTDPLRNSAVESVKKKALAVWTTVHEDALRKANSAGVNQLRKYRDGMPDRDYGEKARAAIHGKYEEAKASFEAQASDADPALVPFFTDLLTRLEKQDDPRVWVRFQSPSDELLKVVDATNKEKGTTDGLLIEAVAPHFSLENSTARETVIRNMMSQGFGAVLPNDVLDLQIGDRLAKEAQAPAEGPSIEVRYFVTPSGAIYSSSNPLNTDKRGFVGIRVDFKVAMRIPEREGVIEFDLNVEPPDQFTVTYTSAAFMGGVGGGASTSQVYSVMAAKAFEKLADTLKTRIFDKDSEAYGSFVVQPPPRPDLKPVSTRPGLPPGMPR